jgi:hypothetical protein
VSFLTAMLGAASAGVTQSITVAGASVTLGADGTVTAISGDAFWFKPPSAGIGSQYWARTTRTGGTTGVVFSPASGTWHALSAGETWFASGGAGNCQGTLEIASDAAGSTIVSTGTISVNNAI